MNKKELLDPPYKDRTKFCFHGDVANSAKRTHFQFPTDKPDRKAGYKQEGISKVGGPTGFVP